MEINLKNYWFVVELIIESSANAATDKSLRVCVIAANEEYALLNAKALLKESNPYVNFLSIWMWAVWKRRSCNSFINVGLARLARYFLLLSQEKVSKEKATPYRFILRLSASSGAACATQPSCSHRT